jgi:hypothetical protein
MAQMVRMMTSIQLNPTSTQSTYKQRTNSFLKNLKKNNNEQKKKNLGFSGLGSAFLFFHFAGFFFRFR